MGLGRRVAFGVGAGSFLPVAVAAFGRSPRGRESTLSALPQARLRELRKRVAAFERSEKVVRFFTAVVGWTVSLKSGCKTPPTFNPGLKSDLGSVIFRFARCCVWSGSEGQGVHPFGVRLERGYRNCGWGRRV